MEKMEGGGSLLEKNDDAYNAWRLCKLERMSTQLQSSEDGN